MLREALQKGEFAITCEFVPGRGKEGTSVDAALHFAREVATSSTRIHAVSLTDNPGGNPAISPDALAPEIQKTGLEALVHFSCRDLNRNAIESRVMALARAGIDNLLVLTGDFPAGGFEGNGAGVFDLDSVQAIKYMKAMNAGLEIPGAKKGTTVRLPQTNFFLGAAVSPAIFGMIADKFDIYKGFYFLAGIIVFANLLVFFLPKESAKPARQASVARK